MKAANIVPRSVGTHDGQFHADEVTACALLLLCDLVDSDKIVRSRDKAVLDTCEYVCDVGGEYNIENKRFDHHQSDYQGEWSSAGMVLDYLRQTRRLTNEEYAVFRDMLIKGVDDHDNGRFVQLPGVQTFSHIIGNFSPVVYGASPEELDAAFRPALAFVHGHLCRMLERFRYTRSCREEVRKQMDTSSRCLYFDRAIPWLESFFQLGGEKHQALFVIMPSGDHWKLRGIPPSMAQRMDVRLPLPEDWAGLLEEDLKEATGIPGAIFCHKGRFISVWETKSDAEEALKMVLSRSGYADSI